MASTANYTAGGGLVRGRGFVFGLLNSVVEG